jgi:hypothetical protein
MISHKPLQISGIKSNQAGMDEAAIATAHNPVMQELAKLEAELSTLQSSSPTVSLNHVVTRSYGSTISNDIHCFTHKLSRYFHWLHHLPPLKGTSRRFLLFKALFAID